MVVASRYMSPYHIRLSYRGLRSLESSPDFYKLRAHIFSVMVQEMHSTRAVRIFYLEQPNNQMC